MNVLNAAELYFKNGLNGQFCYVCFFTIKKKRGGGDGEWKREADEENQEEEGKRNERCRARPCSPSSDRRADAAPG